MCGLLTTCASCAAWRARCSRHSGVDRHARAAAAHGALRDGVARQAQLDRRRLRADDHRPAGASTPLPTLQVAPASPCSEVAHAPPSLLSAWWLQRRVPADDGEGGRGLESRLRADLESLGFGAADVDHIEVGRHTHSTRCNARVPMQPMHTRPLQHTLRPVLCCTRLDPCCPRLAGGPLLRPGDAAAPAQARAQSPRERDRRAPPALQEGQGRRRGEKAAGASIPLPALRVVAPLPGGRVLMPSSSSLRGGCRMARSRRGPRRTRPTSRTRLRTARRARAHTQTRERRGGCPLPTPVLRNGARTSAKACAPEPLLSSPLAWVGGCGRSGRTSARCRSSSRSSARAPPGRASSRRATPSSASPPRRGATSCSSYSSTPTCSTR